MRDNVLAGRVFYHPKEMDDAFFEWLPTRRSQVHRTHGEVIELRAEADRAALLPLPASPYLVCDRHLRSVGKDCLISFEGSLYSVPWRRVKRRMRVELRVTSGEVRIYSLGPEPDLLAKHGRAQARASWVVDPAHWEGLPGADKAASDKDEADTLRPASPGPELLASRSLLSRVPVARRDLATYDRIGAWS